MQTHREVVTDFKLTRYLEPVHAHGDRERDGGDLDRATYHHLRFSGGQIYGEPPLPHLPADTASRWITSGWEVRILQPKKWTGEERGAESDPQQVSLLYPNGSLHRPSASSSPSLAASTGKRSGAETA